MTRVLLDQGLAPQAAAILRQYGIDAVHVSELQLDRAEDAVILDRARMDNRICVTLDHDFHTHLAVARLGLPSVVLLRVQGLGAQAQADLIRAICHQCVQHLAAGAAVSADQKNIRIRRLPLK